MNENQVYTMATAKLSDEEYDDRICAGYGANSVKELLESQVFKDALAANKNDMESAMRALEVKKEKWPTVNGWFLGAIPDWNFNKEELTGKTTIIVLTKDGDVVEKKIMGTVNSKWVPISTKVTVGPITRSTYLLRDADDPKRVVLNYKEAQIREAKHDDALPSVALPGALDAINYASQLQTRGRVVVRGKAKDVVVLGRVTDDPSQIQYRSGDEFEESLTVPIVCGDGAVIQTKFKADALYSPDHVAKVFGIEKDQDAFADALINQPVLGLGQLGITMPWEPLKETANEPGKEPADVERYLAAFRERGWLAKDTNRGTGEVRERINLKGKFEENEDGTPRLVNGKKVPLRALVFCGREIVDLGFEENDDGEEVPVASVLMTDQPGKYPWFSVNPGAPSEKQPDRPANNSAGFFLFLEKQLAGEIEIQRDDTASRMAERWAKYANQS